MDRITSALARAGNYMATMGIADFVDIIIVAYLIYRAIWFIRKSNFINLAKGLILVLMALWVSIHSEIGLQSFTFGISSITHS